MFPRIGDEMNWRGVDDGYDELARNLLAGHGYVMAPGRPGNLMTPPGYTFLLSALYAIAGVETVEGPRLWILQSALDALTCGFIYAIGALALGDRRVGLVAALSWALYPQIVVYAARIGPEVLFTLLFALLFAAWLRLEARGGARHALLAGAVWAALTLTKEKAVLLPAVLLARLLWVRRAAPGRGAREAAAFVVAALAILAPWLYRGYALTGGFVPITLRGGRALDWGMRAEFGGADTYMVDGFSRDPRRGALPTDSFPVLTEEERRTATRGLRAHETSRTSRVLGEIAAAPLQFARKTAVRFAAYWYWGQPRVIAGNALVNLPLLALGIAGLRLAWGSAPASVALLMILYMNALHAVTVVRMRYSLPVMPFVILFAAAACVWIAGRAAAGAAKRRARDGARARGAA